MAVAEARTLWFGCAAALDLGFVLVGACPLPVAMSANIVAAQAAFEAKRNFMHRTISQAAASCPFVGSRKGQETETAEKAIKNRELACILKGMKYGFARVILASARQLLAPTFAPVARAGDLRERLCDQVWFDPGLRAAAYADGRLTPEQLFAANEREGRLVFDQAVRNRNPWLWRTAAGREALRKVAHGPDLQDWCWDLYENISAIIAKEHPDWFKE